MIHHYQPPKQDALVHTERRKALPTGMKKKKNKTNKKKSKNKKQKQKKTRTGINERKNGRPNERNNGRTNETNELSPLVYCQT